jgi:hypothetical protein
MDFFAGVACLTSVIMPLMLLIFVLSLATSSYADCVDQVLPRPGDPQNVSYQNPTCLPGGGIAFTRFSRYNQEPGQVFDYNPRLGTIRLIHQGVNNVGKVSFFNKVQNPDGTYSGFFAYSQKDPDGGNEIIGISKVTYIPSTGERTYVPDRLKRPANRKGGITEPGFSCDGKAIVYENQPYICVISLNGNSDSPGDCLKKTEAAQPTVTCKDPQHPGVVFQAVGDHGYNELFETTFSIDDDGKWRVGKVASPIGSGRGTDVSASPGENYLVYSHELNDGAVLNYKDVTGGNPKTVKMPGHSNKYNGAVSWCKEEDGEYLYFESGKTDDPERDGKTVICRVHAPVNDALADQIPSAGTQIGVTR